VLLPEVRYDGLDKVRRFYRELEERTDDSRRRVRGSVGGRRWEEDRHGKGRGRVTSEPAPGDERASIHSMAPATSRPCGSLS
jgi:hypothetical protein